MRNPVRLSRLKSSYGDWICLRFAGSFDLFETGIVLSALQPLPEDGIGVRVWLRRDILPIKNGALMHAQMLPQNARYMLV